MKIQVGVPMNINVNTIGIPKTDYANVLGFLNALAYAKCKNIGTHSYVENIGMLQIQFTKKLAK